MSHTGDRAIVRGRRGASARGGRTQAFRVECEGLEIRALLATLNVTVLPFTATEGLLTAIFQGTVTDSDPTVTAGNLNAAINWGDGTPPTPGTISGVTGGPFMVTANHTFPEESGSVVPPVTFTVTLTVNDTKNSVQATGTGEASVNDAPLTPGNPIVPGAPQLFTGVGTANATAALTSFVTAVGGVDNGGTPSPQIGGTRRINWDGVKVDGTDFGGGANTTVISPNSTIGIPLDRFQTRGVYFGAVYAVSSDSFATVNPNAAGLFPPFSPKNTFAMFNDNGIDFKFVAPSANGSTIVSAASRGFGAIFLNVEIPNTTSIQYFNGATSLGTLFVQPGAKGQPEFAGELYNNAVVTNVVLSLGTGVLFKFDGTTFSSAGAVDNPANGQNLVVTDDFVYAEPVPIANGFAIISGAQGSVNAPTIATPTAGVTFAGVVGTFSDLDPNGNAKDYTATINWGDGHLTNGAITSNGKGGFDVSGTNTYARAGTFPINVDVADFGGGPGAGGSNPTLSINNTAQVAKENTAATLQVVQGDTLAGQPVTFTATVTVPLGTTPPAGFVTFFDGATPLSGVAVAANGQATFTTTALAAGSHSITAAYGGDPNTNPITSAVSTVTVAAPPVIPPPQPPPPTVIQVPVSVSVPVVITPRVIDGPIIVNLQRRGSRRQSAHLVLTFNEALNPARASSSGNYQLMGFRPDRAPRRTTVHRAVYNPALNRVTLTPSEPLDPHRVYQLTVNGTAPLGVSDPSGILLDGANSGNPGSNYTAIVPPSSDTQAR